ncbi:hypothetical protein DET61_11976 [Marinobacter nauticus]|uniref:Uncharacterized protein n=1 Tax=Marinobacter nauticus TaxID=2743 RepID=A0A368X7X7_MARNT|nr:hypothetical protein [Marinobacter nauticus]RCW63306.1 hypothetical protein DET61_11976 [Marinobacter nauticus]
MNNPTPFIKREARVVDVSLFVQSIDSSKSQASFSSGHLGGQEKLKRTSDQV